MANIEIEVKARVDDLGALEKRLRRMGAKKVDKVVERDIYYSHPCRDFARTDEALRIRVFGGRSTLTYKGPKLDSKSKSREEIIIELEEPALARQLLARLGFRKVAGVRKRRSIFVLGKFELCLDRVEGVGTYVEIETRAPRNGYAKLRNKALALLKELGGERVERRSYLELLLSGQDR